MSLGVLLASILLVIQEALFRAVFPVPEVLNFDRIAYSAVADRAALAHPVSNACYTWTSAPDGAAFVHHLNLYGFRDPETWPLRKRSPTIARVMFVGDSFVEGVMASDRDTIPAVFGQVAGDRGRPVEALNLGIGGTSPRQHLQLIRDAAPLFRPDILVLIFYANDFPCQYDGRWLRVPPLRPVHAKPWIPRVAVVARRAMLGEPVPRRWHGRAFPYFRPVPDPANPLTARARGYEPLIAPTLLAAMRQGTLNPWLPDELGLSRKALSEPIDPSEMLDDLKSFATETRTELFVAYLPSRLQVSDYYSRFEKQYAIQKDVPSLMGGGYQIHAGALDVGCSARGLPFLDLTGSFRTEEQEGHHLYWDYDNHLRGAGYRLAAGILWQWIASHR